MEVAVRGFLPLPTSAVLLNTGPHHANCGLSLKVPDYWISVCTLCIRVLSEPDLRGGLLACVCLHHAYMWIACIIFIPVN